MAVSDVFELETMLVGPQKHRYEHYRSVHQILSQDMVRFRRRWPKRAVGEFLGGFSCLVDFFDSITIMPTKQPVPSLDKEVFEVLHMLDTSAKEISFLREKREKNIFHDRSR